MLIGLWPFAPALVWACWSLVGYRKRREFMRQGRREVEELTRSR